MSELLFDIRFALRQLRANPLFFGTLLFVLIAGIGATTAMFSISESLFLKPLPYPEAQQLDVVWRTQQTHRRWPHSRLDFEDLHEQAESYSHLAAIQYAGYSLSSPGAEPAHLAGANVTGDFFSLWKLPPLHGRLFGPDDDKEGAPAIAVISADLWKHRFNADPSAVGRSITLNGRDHTIVGVAHEGFNFAGPNVSGCKVWVPIHVASGQFSTETRGNHYLVVLGRRESGVTQESAQAEVDAIMARLESKYPNTNAKSGARVERLRDSLVGDSRSSVWMLFAAVALVFLIVCANVASLLLTRAQGRRSEVALRTALGAPPSRVVRQFLTETVVVFMLGAVGGSVLSFWLVEMFRKGLVHGAASTLVVGVDWVALTVTSLVAGLCGVLFGLIPALAVAGTEPQSVLKSSAARAGVSGRQKLVRAVLVVAQVTLACTLLIGSALALQGFRRLADKPLGLDPSNLEVGRLSLIGEPYQSKEPRVTFIRALETKLAAVPGSTHVIINSTLPMMGSNSNGSFEIEGKPGWPQGEEPLLERNLVNAGYFQALGIPLLKGREFNRQDDESARQVIIINQRAAEAFFAGEDPIGQRIDWNGSGVWREVVGIVGNVPRYDPYEPLREEAYVPYCQSPSRYVMFGVRTRDMKSTAKAIPSAVQEVDPTMAVASLDSYGAHIDRLMSQQRYAVQMLLAFAIAALILAGMGLFGLVSYSTEQRTREMGLRMALGSPPGAVVGLVVGGGMRLLGYGVLMGLLGAAVMGRSLAEWMPGVERFDPLAFGAVPLLLALIGALACLLPAWKAMRIPPAAALRYE